MKEPPVLGVSALPEVPAPLGAPPLGAPPLGAPPLLPLPAPVPALPPVNGVLPLLPQPNVAIKSPNPSPANLAIAAYS
jgi:hypothetical protein